jgi:putative ABC transport system permease protein
LILLLVGLTAGSLADSGRRVAGVGADIVFQSEGASYVLAVSSTPILIETGDKIREVEGVAAVAPIVTMVNPGGGFNVIYGLEPESFNAVSGGFEFTQGRMFSAPDEALVDDLYASRNKVGPGNEITLLNRKFKVSGVVVSGKGARLFMPLATAQQMQGREGKASLFFVKAKQRSEVPELIKRLSSGDFVGHQVNDVDEFARQVVASNQSLLDAVFNVIVFVGLAIGILVIFLSMYTTITERTREIGVLRALGATKGQIVALILKEAVLVCVVGAVAGIAFSFFCSYLIRSVFPTMIISITPDWLVRAGIFAVLSGILGSVYPALSAASKDPVEAIAYE